MKMAAFHFALVLSLAPCAALADPGEALALSCWNCHGPEGRSEGAIPPIAGMAADELAAAMRDFRSDAREATIMNRIAKAYTDAEIDALSAYLASVGDQP